MRNGLIILSNGDKIWYQNNRYHRLDGPAIIYRNGDMRWYQNNQRHRLDGPAVEDIDGTKLWYFKGKHIVCSSQREFERQLKLKAFW